MRGKLRPKWGEGRHREQGRAGLRVAASVPTLFLRRPGGPGTATGDRGRNAALATAPPAAPSVASDPTTRGSSGVAAVQIGSRRKGSIRLRAWVRSRWVCLRLSWIFGASFAVKGLRSWVGSARWESADLRASDSDALPRPVPLRARAGLAGANTAPAPGPLSITRFAGRARAARHPAGPARDDNASSARSVR